MSMLMNLVSSSDGNDIGVGLTKVVYFHSVCPLFNLEQIFLPSLDCILFFKQSWLPVTHFNNIATISVIIVTLV